MNAEEWRPIAWAPSYAVSDRGRVMSFRGQQPRVLCPSRNQWGYLFVGLTRPDGTRWTRSVHRLVADAFLGPCPPGMETCHNDGDKTNNAPSNLRFDTKSQNALDRVRHGADRNARKLRCLRNHPFTVENTRITSRGSRQCLTCLCLRRSDPAAYYATAERHRSRAA